MALKKSEKTLLAVGGSAIVIMLIWTFAGSDEESKTNASTPKKVVQNIQSSIKDVQAGIKSDVTPSIKIRFDSWGRDPFKDQYATSREEEEGRGNLVVKGIIRQGNKYHVMINDIILAEGEEKDGLYIERIEDKQVFCKKGGQWFTLTWKEEP